MRQGNIIAAVVALSMAAPLGVAFSAEPAARGGQQGPNARQGDQGGPPDGAPEGRPVGEGEQTMSGAVQSFNLGPRGDVNGVILAVNGKVVQVNCRPELAAQLKAGVRVGDQVTAAVMPDRAPSGGGNGPEDGPGGMGPGGDGGNGAAQGNDGPPDQAPAGGHAMYRLVSLTTAQGRKIGEGGLGQGKRVHLNSTVKALNYDMRGSVNGVQLTSGEFVEISPREAGALNLSAGAQVSVEGTQEPGAGGTPVVHAVKINGTAVRGQRPGRGSPGGDGGPDGQGGPSGQGGPDGGGGPGMDGGAGGAP